MHELLEDIAVAGSRRGTHIQRLPGTSLVVPHASGAAAQASGPLVWSDAPATMMKPLCGLEPGLEENLTSFFLQDYPKFEILFGTRDASDPALDVVRRYAHAIRGYQ